MPDSELLPESLCDHLFRTTISPDKFEAVVARSCRSAYTIEIQGSDPTIIPQPRVFAVNFTSLEDRDRVRIAMRFVEKEQADTFRERRSAPRTAAARAVVGAA